MIKYFVAQVDKVARSQTSIPNNCKAFLENLQGIVFYAVPHSGSSEDVAKFMRFCKNVHTSTCILSLSTTGMPLQESSQEMEKLNYVFRRLIKEDTMIMAIVEGRPMGQEVQFHN